MKRTVVILSLVFLTSFFASAQRNSTVTLSPVPLTIDQLTVGMKSMTASKANTVELRNFIGKKLQAANSDGKSVVKFNDMLQYPEGVYVIIIKSKNGKFLESRKFTISK